MRAVLQIAKTGSRVLWYEGVGFALIIGLVWVDHSSGYARLFFGPDQPTNNWRESAMETAIILIVALVVFRLTRRLLARLTYLEGLLRVCAWCRKIYHKGRWLRLEQYFEEGLHVETTHGMCPDCLKKVEEDTAQFKRSELEKKPPLPDPLLPDVAR